MGKGEVLLVNDDATFRSFLNSVLSIEGYTVTDASDRESAFEKFNKNNYDVVLLDISIPKMNAIDTLDLIRQKQTMPEVIVLTDNIMINNALECMRLGAFGYIRRPYSMRELLIYTKRAIEHRRQKTLKNNLNKNGTGITLIGKSKTMSDLRNTLAKIAPTNSNILILGGSGSGKEVVARSIHSQSPRAEKPFVPVNCASLSEALLESELFGYEKGAFTDAKIQKPGLAEIADGGTLFLDEIGEIPFHLQAKLLRFLESGDIRRVGATKDIHLNVRIICATNQPLEKLVMEKKFREDLFYRLNVLPVPVPPLTKHADDIPLLVNHFVERLGYQKQFDESAMDMLKAYTWPGNVRELKNVVERTCILSHEKIVCSKDILFLCSIKPRATG
ncbi:MAG: sigma-54 dependent transcriptional regulator [Chitinispirillales bacterium]|jgi:DNA-binding NtrC family response regulator|nr:sigma-54 dependent transcriptional regulator [Chitinispirillales bacterium]